MALVDDLKAARDNLGAIIKTKTDAWVAAGCPPSFSVDGESYQWNEWLSSKIQAVNDLTDQIARVSSPWIVRSRGKG